MALDHPNLANPSRATALTTFRILATSLILLCLVLVIRRAWVSDDAFITFRTADNLVHGYGPTWNVDERVQTFTHPLWMFMLAAANAITHEFYFTSLGLMVALTALALLLYSQLSVNPGTGTLLGLFILACSNAFIDFSTSGLDNALTHVLLIGFYAFFLSLPASPKKIFLLSLTTAFIGLNRLDATLLVAPALLFSLVELRSLHAFKPLVLGLIPIILWELFSLFYYGFLFPNTAYAKLDTGIPLLSLIQQGYAYLLNSLLFDPVTLMAVLAAVCLGVMARRWKLLVIVAGIVLNLVYVVRVGGDFMTGRFLTGVLVCAVILIGQIDFSDLDAHLFFLPFAAVFILGLAAPLPSFELSDPRYPSNPVDIRGIADERQYYQPETSLAVYTRGRDYTAQNWYQEGLKARGNHEKVTLVNSIGMYGLAAGPGVHIIDPPALADPLLARLPARGGGWRIGHFDREIPIGYWETLQTGVNQIEEPNLAAYYEVLRLITRGPLWDGNRLLEIWYLNTGKYDDLLDCAQCIPGSIHLSSLAQPKQAGAPWNFHTVKLDGDGIDVKMGRTTCAATLDISLDNNDDYELTFMKGTQVVGNYPVQKITLPNGGLQVYAVPVPQTAVQAGYDVIHVAPVSGDGSYSIGHLILIP
jgi:arabinofuranosyltransferase